jgi:hypothetical protein
MSDTLDPRQVMLARAGIDAWVRLATGSPTNTQVRPDGSMSDALELMTAELFDATPWSALVVAIEEGS